MKMLDALHLDLHLGLPTGLPRALLSTTLAASLSLMSYSAFAQDSDEWDAMYKEALNMRANGDLYGAVDALNSLLAQRPTLHRARLELAVSYYRAARYDQARAEAEQVLADPSTPENVRDTIALFIDQVTSIKEADDQVRHRFAGSLSMGGGYDNNVNAGPSSDTFDISGAEFRLLDGSTQASDAFASVNLRGSHTYRLPGSLAIGERPVQALWQSSATAYRKEYQDSHPYTVDVVSVTTGPALVSKTNWRAQANLQFDYIRLGDNSLAVYTSLNPSYTLVAGRQEVNLRGQWLYREFMTASNRDREGERYSLGLDYGFRINEILSLQLGTTFYEQEARSDTQHHDVQDFFASVYWLGWENGSVYARASYRDTDYEGEEILFLTGRKEREQRYIIGATHDFREGQLEGWGLGLRVAYTDNHANIDIYQYDRTELNLDVTRRF